MSNTSIARASVGRSIPSAPLRILDAPDLVDDYYLNLISWGHNNVSYIQSLCLLPFERHSVVRIAFPLGHQGSRQRTSCDEYVDVVLLCSLRREANLDVG